MANRLSIPMLPGDLPPQRLYVVPSWPSTPPGWQADLVNQSSGLPPRMPHSARFLTQVEWAWSPMHNRIDAYYLSLSTHRDRHVLWVCYFDDERWRFVDHHIVASAPRSGLQGADAAILLLRAFWANEAAGDMELDRPHWINEPGLLSVGQLKEIYRRVWCDRGEGE